jgi:F-type H+-transporting ATPase subunit a
MNETFLAAEGGAPIHVGTHEYVFQFLGMTFNGDTIISTVIAAIIVIALAFFLKSKVTSTGVPGGVQLFFEAITIQMRQQVEAAIGMKIAPFVLPLAVTIFVFILVSNWLAVLPVQYGGSDGAAGELIKALAAFVFICYNAAGIWRRGAWGHAKKLVKGHVTLMAPINIIEELAKPISLALRLFGNIFAGGILVALIAMFPWYIQWAPNAIWKTFDLFVGLIQAFIFALLTILYFSQSMELDHDHEDENEKAHH